MPDLTDKQIEQMQKHLGLLARTVCEHVWLPRSCDESMWKVKSPLTRILSFLEKDLFNRIYFLIRLTTIFSKQLLQNLLW